MEKAMKIEPFSGKPVLESKSGGPPSTGTPRARADDSQPPGAKVSLSNLSSELHSLESQLREPGGGFDAARVDAIKSAMRAGRFQVNAEAVADKLVASVRELIGR
jgi:negative regulator of flagellin synthesis FlgM